MKAMILIPTYNEATSVVELLDALGKLRQTNNFDFDVTVIDDNSPDKTAEIVDSLALDWVSILKRAKKDGLLEECAECRPKIKHEYYLRHKDEIKAKTKNYRAGHKYLG